MDRLASSFILSFFGKDRNAGSWQLGGTPIEIHAPTERYSHPAICIDSEFSRIIGFQEETNIQIEMDRLSAGIHRHGGTYAYKIHDAVFFKDSVVKGNKNFGGRRISRIKSIFGRYEYMDEALLCSNDLTDRYFGHWLRDSLITEILAQEMGLRPLTYGAGKWVHEQGYRELAGLQSQNITAAKFQKLWVVDDRGLNDGWVRRMEKLRSTIRANSVKNDVSQRVFMKRGTKGAVRLLRNEAEIEKYLINCGFVVIDPENMSVREISAALSGANTVVFVEGSAQNHYLLNGPKGGRVLTIQPPERFNSFFKTFCDAVGLRWGYVVGDHNVDGSFSVPIARLEQTLNLYKEI